MYYKTFAINYIFHILIKKESLKDLLVCLQINIFGIKF